MDSLDRSVVGEGVSAELTSDAGLLESSEGDLRVELVVAAEGTGDQRKSRYKLTSG